MKGRLAEPAAPFAPGPSAATDAPVDRPAGARLKEQLRVLGGQAGVPVFTRATDPVDVAVAGAITVGREGRLLAPIAEMAELGVRLFTDDGVGVQDASLMRRALSYAKPLGVRLAQHCEDESLANGGSMNEGALSGRLGLIGRPALAEELMVLRDIELARLTGGALHFLHLSTSRSIAMVVWVSISPSTGLAI